MRASDGSGTKKRMKMLPGGSSETTGAPACSVSPGRASTSATNPATGEATERWARRQRAWASAASAASTAEAWATISSGRPSGACACW